MAATSKAIRALVRGRVQGVGYRAATVDQACALGVLGWVRNEPEGTVALHAEGAADAVDALAAFLHEGPPGAHVEEVAVAVTKVEGHEQFAVRGVPAGRFTVAPLGGERGGFVLRLEVDGRSHSWRLTKPPSMVPAEKRFASELAATDDAAADGTPLEAGLYEQGGRVAWPEAIDRGHAVFVLHGQELKGGFALQRTRGEGPGSGWLLIKRRDAFAVTK